LAVTLPVRGQADLTRPVTGTFTDITVVEFMEILETRYQTKFYYDPSKIPYYRLTFEFNEEPLYRALTRFLDGSNLDVIKFGNGIVLANKHVSTRSSIEKLIENWESGEFTKPISYEPLRMDLTLGDWTAPAAENLNLSGSVRDKYTQEGIVGVVIQNQLTGLGTVTDENGKFELQGSPGNYQYLISYLGYQPINLELGWYADGHMDLEMQVWALNLSEVVVEATAVQNKIDETQIGVEALSVQDIRELPSFLGEADVLKSLEQLPGVSTVGEASTGFNVRGGNIDQNLVMLDDAILFNASHVLGLFSIFNADAVRNVSLYKGNIPAQYGGRLSSVLQVESKDANTKRWQGRGGIGLASSRLVMDGPLGESTGLLVGLRSSYSNWLLRRVRKSSVRDSRAYFGDAILKINHQFNDEHSVSISTYLSHDFFQFTDEFGYSWTSWLGNLKWRYLINNNTSFSTSVISGRYDSNQFVPQGDDAFDLFNGISYLKVKSNLSFQNENHFFNTGIEAISLDMDPERIEPYSIRSSINSSFLSKDQGMELGVYINDEINISPRISFSAGIRFSYYAALGPMTLRKYREGLPRTSENAIGTEVFDKNDKIASYQGLEPRFSFSYRIDDRQAVKFSYNRLKQYIHLVSSTATSTPVDIWQLSNDYLQPQNSSNFSAGYFRKLADDWDVSVEGFYKELTDLPLFKDLASLLLNEELETEIVPGIGRSYGAEFSLVRSLGEVSGHLAYTFSRSEAMSISSHLTEQIDNNQWHFSQFDQPHQLNIQFKYEMDPVHHVQFGFAYKTGRPITVPVSNYEVQGVLITHYSGRNLFRVPAYHRFDIGYTVDKSKAKIRGLRSSWTVSFYNLYGRKNAFSIYFRRDSRNIQRAYKLSVLGATFPSLTWNFMW